MGICVPHTCKPNQIDDLLKKTITNLFKYNIDKEIINNRFCDLKKSTSLQPIDIFAM